ncbi:hypothetical protein L210DRAFT_3557497 [Boletus edulis BED1]|uniref:Secreted protein n=1 Tax=Boletus edulis BED1 TaxID=1328754 RepID=A0AAD4BJW0_BOLED|nr:hypothetical protein L210DRAFT_3557497 [Boletus edulis BED1]
MYYRTPVNFLFLWAAIRHAAQGLPTSRCRPPVMFASYQSRHAQQPQRRRRLDCHLHCVLGLIRLWSPVLRHLQHKRVSLN